jgi:hypothetical protein
MSLPVRIIVAGIVGGILVFFMGFVEHELLGWGSRTFSNIQKDDEFRENLKEHQLPPAIYAYPQMPKDKSPAEMDPFMKKWAAGPSGFLIVAPTGDMQMPKMLGLELLTNVIAALIAAWIVSLISADKPFLWRWKVVVLIAIFGWVSLVASYGIWYSFPWPFIRDDLLCTILEWSVGGAAIAGFVDRSSKLKKQSA